MPTHSSPQATLHDTHTDTVTDVASARRGRLRVAWVVELVALVEARA